MKVRMRRYSVFPYFGLVVALLMIWVYLLNASCATPPGISHYDQTLVKWNDAMDSYRYQFERQTPEVQAKWTEEINPILLQASTALNTWGEAQNDYGKEQAFIALERQAFDLLAKYAIPTTTKEGDS
jgi:hypothetical protein